MGRVDHRQVVGLGLQAAAQLVVVADRLDGHRPLEDLRQVGRDRRVAPAHLLERHAVGDALVDGEGERLRPGADRQQQRGQQAARTRRSGDHFHVREITGIVTRAHHCWIQDQPPVDDRKCRDTLTASRSPVTAARRSPPTLRRAVCLRTSASHLAPQAQRPASCASSASVGLLSTTIPAAHAQGAVVRLSALPARHLKIHAHGQPQALAVARQGSSSSPAALHCRLWPVPGRGLWVRGSNSKPTFFVVGEIGLELCARVLLETKFSSRLVSLAVCSSCSSPSRHRLLQDDLAGLGGRG